MKNARALCPKQPFRIITDVGEVLVLPPDLADEIRNDPNLNLSRAVFVVLLQSLLCYMALSDHDFASGLSR